MSDWELWFMVSRSLHGVDGGGLRTYPVQWVAEGGGWGFIFFVQVCIILVWVISVLQRVNLLQYFGLFSASSMFKLWVSIGFFYGFFYSRIEVVWMVV